MNRWVYDAELPSRGRWAGCDLRQVKLHQVDGNRERGKDGEQIPFDLSTPSVLSVFYDIDSRFISKKKITIQEINFKENWPRLVPRHPLNQLERCMWVYIWPTGRYCCLIRLFWHNRPSFYWDTHLPALLCQSQFVRVIIISAAVLFPPDIFYFSQRTDALLGQFGQFSGKNMKEGLRVWE